MPLAADVCPTSSFGSWRSGHLHAGLDFSTGGRTGVPVLAVDSCWVQRIRIWNGGYGRALYVQLADGKIAVYGHLERFNAGIEALVEREQDLKASYEVEICPQPFAFRFCPGETLAFSGDTGSGPPHLHFELRSGPDDHYKINPVPLYMSIPERLAPAIRDVRVLPLSSDSRLGGGYRETGLTGRAEGDTLAATGRFGLCVRAVDDGRCGKKLTPVVYEAAIDGMVVSRLEFDTFPFSKSNYEGAIYRIIDGRSYVCLFAPRGLDLEGFNVRTPGWDNPVGKLEAGLHRMVVRVEDAWGNADSVKVPFRYGSVPRFAYVKVTRDSLGVVAEVDPEDEGCEAAVLFRIAGGGWQHADLVPQASGFRGRIDCSNDPVEMLARLSNGDGFSADVTLAPDGPEPGDNHIKVETVTHPDYVEILAYCECPPSALPVARIYQGSWVKLALLQPAGRGAFRTTYVPETGDDPVHIRLTSDFGGHDVDWTGGMMLRWIRPGSEVRLFGEHFMLTVSGSQAMRCRSLATYSEEQGRCPDGFTGVRGRIRLEPGTAFFDLPLAVSLVSKQGMPGPKYGVFSDGGGRPGFLAAFGEGGTCSFHLRRLFPLIILEDTVPPSITCPARLHQRSDGKALFSGKVADSGSGVDVSSIKAFVDDEAAIVSYDPDTGTVQGRTIKPLQYGKHRIRLEADDRLANSTRIEVTADMLR